MLAVAVGSLAQFLTLLTILLVAVPLLRGARGAAVENLRRERDELERELKACQSALSARDALVLELQQKTDISVTQERIIGAIETHEAASNKRDEAVLGVLSLIADRLGHE